MTYLWNEHRNDLDDWCPWSGRALDTRERTELEKGEITGKPEDFPECAAGCRTSRAIKEDEEP